MRRLSLGEVLRLHRLLIESSGGAPGLRDLGRLESALAQPWQTFDGVDLYADVVAKAATLAFALIQGHPFIDGNKRIGHAGAEVFLVLNGLALHADVEEQEKVILAVASGNLDRPAFEAWLRTKAAKAGP
jgi:death on curing protein